MVRMPSITVSTMALSCASLSRSAAAARSCSVTSQNTATPATIPPVASRTGAELTLMTPRVPSPRWNSIFSATTTSPCVIERASGQSCGS